MKISESAYNINESGELRIPAETLKEMGLKAKDCVLVAFLSSDGVRNDYKEFLIAPVTDDEEDDAKQIGIPSELLLQADIPDDADLQIVCGHGFILIARDASMSGEALEEVSAAIRAADEVVGQLPVDLDISDVERKFRDALSLTEEGVPTDE